MFGFTAFVLYIYNGCSCVCSIQLVLFMTAVFFKKKNFFCITWKFEILMATFAKPNRLFAFVTIDRNSIPKNIIAN